MKQILWVSMVGFLGFLLVSCSSDDGTTRRYQTGVAATGPVATLDNTQLQRICSSFDAYVDTTVGFDQIAYVACLPAAIVLGGNSAGCSQRLSDCMALFPKPVGVQAHVHDPQVCFDNLQQCQATVSLLEDCVNVNLTRTLDILDRWSCKDAGDVDLQKAAARAMETVAVCGKVDAACNRFATIVPE